MILGGIWTRSNGLAFREALVGDTADEPHLGRMRSCWLVSPRDGRNNQSGQYNLRLERRLPGVTSLRGGAADLCVEKALDECAGCMVASRDQVRRGRGCGGVIGMAPQYDHVRPAP